MFKFNYRLFLIFSFYLLPFSYVLIGDFRVLFFETLFVLLFIFISGFRLKLTSDVILFITYMVSVFLASFFSLQFEVFFSLSVFFILAYWPYFTSASNCRKVSLSKLVHIYVLGACFCAVGVIFQSLTYLFFGFEFGKIDFYFNRTGFGFLWLDYSFLSLYLVSAIPLVFSNVLSKWRYTISLLLIVGSMTTTARTGLFSLFIVLFGFGFIRFVKSVMIMRINKALLAYSVLAIILFLTFPFIWQVVSDRELTSSGSGRFDGYYNSFILFLENPFFGLNYNIAQYKLEHGAIPHNLFLYILTFGGLFGATIFFSWLIVFLLRVKSSSANLITSLFVIIFGCQFIPSVFSAYFLAVIISIIHLQLRQRTCV